MNKSEYRLAFIPLRKGGFSLQSVIVSVAHMANLTTLAPAYHISLPLPLQQNQSPSMQTLTSLKNDTFIAQADMSNPT